MLAMLSIVCILVTFTTLDDINTPARPDVFTPSQGTLPHHHWEGPAPSQCKEQMQVSN